LRTHGLSRFRLAALRQPHKLYHWRTNLTQTTPLQVRSSVCAYSLVKDQSDSGRPLSAPTALGCATYSLLQPFIRWRSRRLNARSESIDSPPEGQ